MKYLELFWYYLSVIPTWTALTIHNTYGIFSVFFITWVRPMKGGMIDSEHPVVTGINPETGDYVWHENVVFASERKAECKDSDRVILESVGIHMSKMVKKSASSKENPVGIPDRLPPAINYIHAGIQYNGGYLIFDDFKDAIGHFSDIKFRKSFWKFIHMEKREPITIFRNKNYDRQEYLEFVCFMRTMFPYFSNSNGNKKRIGWGNVAPYPSVNTITGYWKNDTYKFYNKESVRKTLARKPISKRYFGESKDYVMNRTEVRYPERYLANFTNDRVLARGEKGNMFFVDLRKLVKGYKFNPANLPNIIDRLKEKMSANYGV